MLRAHVRNLILAASIPAIFLLTWMWPVCAVGAERKAPQRIAHGLIQDGPDTLPHNAITFRPAPIAVDSDPGQTLTLQAPALRFSTMPIVCTDGVGVCEGGDIVPWACQTDIVECATVGERVCSETGNGHSTSATLTTCTGTDGATFACCKSTCGSGAEVTCSSSH